VLAKGDEGVFRDTALPTLSLPTAASVG
jgi:hypothetical protein